jgi:phosphoglycolate phosphatase-like HAD superfamily hydrolase
MKLIIFDMDQTLVELLNVHNETMRKLFLRFFGLEAIFTETDFSGRSFTENILALAALKGIAESRIKPVLNDMLAAYDGIFVGELPSDARRYVLPGVVPLLEALRKAGHLLALYTGDSRAVVNSVLEATGLGGYFGAAFCGTEVPTRDDMVRQVIEWAKERTAHAFAGREIVIIGDSVRDVACGKAFGAVTIAVATGHQPYEQLAQTAPDYLFRDLSDTAAVLDAILS